jgi:DNA repair protein RadC
VETCYELETFKVKLSIADPAPAEKASCSDAAVKIFRAIYSGLDADQEHFTILFLDNKNVIRAYKTLFTGSQTAGIVHPAVVFRTALLFGAVALVVCHNHPSGDPAPSFEDKDITRRLKESAAILGIRFLDHIILGNGRFYSFSDQESLDRELEDLDRVAQRLAKKAERRESRRAKKENKSIESKPKGEIHGEKSMCRAIHGGEQ